MPISGSRTGARNWDVWDRRGRRRCATKRTGLAKPRAALESFAYSPKQLAGHGIAVNQDGVRRTGFDLLALPDLPLEKIAALCPGLESVPTDYIEQIQIDSRYAGYL